MDVGVLLLLHVDHSPGAWDRRRRRLAGVGDGKIANENRIPELVVY